MYEAFPILEELKTWQRYGTSMFYRRKFNMLE